MVCFRKQKSILTNYFQVTFDQNQYLKTETVSLLPGDCMQSDQDIFFPFYTGQKYIYEKNKDPKLKLKAH